MALKDKYFILVFKKFLSFEKKINLIILSSFIFLFLSSCSTNPLLTGNVELNTPQNEKMQNETNRFSNLITYQSNLKNFIYPTEEELFIEANFNNKSLYSQNIKVLSNWINRELTLNQRKQLSKNCETLVGKYEEKFPLDEQSIACAAWWIEKKNLIISQEKKQNLEENDSVYFSEKDKKNWLNFKDLTWAQVFPLIELDSKEKRENYVTSAIKYAHNCSLKNANSALILKLENYLPNQNISESIEKIYSKMLNCLIPNEEPAEKIHLRMGLLRLMKGNTKLASESLNKTQLEKKPQEAVRSLFWLGVLYQKEHPTEKTNIYWEKLNKENPLSLAAVVANQQLGIDPMSKIVPDENISLQNRIEGGWTKENLETFILDALLARKKSDAVKNWANYIAKTLSTTDPSVILYWSLTQNKLHNYYNSIIMLSRYARYQKNYLVSRGLLNLHFPRVYLQEILNAYSPVDPLFSLALMRQESAFDENARSSANARGLMQILPLTAKGVKKSVRPEDLYDPETNIEVGNAYLERLFKRYTGNSEYVLAAYNAGALNLDKWVSRVPSENLMLFCDFIPYKETRNYVSIILRNYYWYARILAESNDPLPQKFLSRSHKSTWKPERLQALLSSYISNSISEHQQNILNQIYIFGNESHLNALR